MDRTVGKEGQDVRASFTTPAEVELIDRTLAGEAEAFYELIRRMAQSSWAPLVPYAKARVHANDHHFGLLLLCFGAGSLLSMPTMGALASRYGCKRLIQFAAGAIFLGLLAVSVAPSSTLLALSLFLFGSSIGAIDVVMNVQAVLVEKHSGENLMSGFHGLYSVGGFAGALLMSGLLWLSTPVGVAALIIVAVLLLLANSALLPYGDDQQTGGSNGQPTTSSSSLRWLSS
jgi:predicted MFS family arabinose efflux permease